MSLAIPETGPTGPPPTAAPSRRPRRFRQLRWRLTRNTIRVDPRPGSRLRLSMILICSAVFWAGLFGLFFGGFQFIGIYVDLVERRSSSTSSACSSCRCW